jgi:predicted nucleic acid-binding Zn ribbon protein
MLIGRPLNRGGLPAGFNSEPNTSTATDMSKYIKPEAKVTIPKHRHCIVCSTPISFDKEFCGPNCQDQFKRQEKKRKYMFIAILLMFPALFLILTLLRR